MNKMVKFFDDNVEEVKYEKLKEEARIKFGDVMCKLDISFARKEITRCVGCHGMD